MSTKEINETREKIQSLIETLRKIKYVKNPIVKKDDTIHELNRILLRLKDDEVRQDPTLVQNLSMQAEKIFRESLAQELYVIQNAEFNNYNANQVVVLQAALAAQLITEQQLRNAIAVRNQRIAQLEANLANEQARVQQLTNDLAQRNADIGVLNRQVQQLTADVNARNAQIAAYQNQIRLMENQLQNIKLAREHFRQVAQQETLRANQAEQNVNQAEQNANQAEQKVNQAEQNVNQLTVDNQVLTNQLEQKTTEFDRLKEAFQYRENEYKALDQAYSLVVREVKQMEAELAAKEQELNAANQQNEQLLQDADLKGQQLENKNAELKRLEHELNIKEQELSAKDLELKVSEQNLAQITKAYMDSQEDKRRLHEEKLKLEERIKFLSSERDKLFNEFKSMTQIANELKDQVIDERNKLEKQKVLYQTKLADEQTKYEDLTRLYQNLKASNQGNLQVNSEQQKTIDELTLAFKLQKALIAKLKANLEDQKDKLTKKQQLINELQTQAKQEQMSAQELQAKIQELEKLNVKQAEELKQISKEKYELEAQISGLEQEIKTYTSQLVESYNRYDELGKMFDENAKDYQSLLSEIKALASGQEYQFKIPIFGQLAQLLKKVEGSSIEDKIVWFGQQIELIGSLKKQVQKQKDLIDNMHDEQGQKASSAEQEILVIQADLDAKQKEIAELRQELIQVADDKKRQDYDLTRLRGQVLQQQGDMAILRQQLEESKSRELKLNKVESDYVDIQKRLAETERQLKIKQEMFNLHAKLRSNATKYMEENQRFKQKIIALEKQLDQKEADYQSKLDNLQKQLTELVQIVQDDKEIQRKHQLELQAQKQQFESERKQANQKLNKEMQELTALLDKATIKAQQKNDELLKQQEFHIKKMQALTNKNAELEKELSNKKTQEEQLLRKITSVISNISFDAMGLDTAIDSFIAEYQKLEKLSTEQKALLEKQARELKQQSELLSAKQSEEQLKVNVTSEELTNLENQIAAQKKQIETLENEKQNLAQANQKLEQNNSELKKANLELQQALDQTLQFLETSKSEEKELQIHSTELLDRVTKLETAISALRDKNSELEEKNAEYSGQEKSNLYGMMENINMLTGKINGFNSYNNNIANLKQLAYQLLSSPNLSESDKTWIRDTIVNLPEQIDSDANLESVMLKLQDAITGTLDIMGKVKDDEYVQDQKISQIAHPISDMLNDFANLIKMRKNMLNDKTYYLGEIDKIRENIKNIREAWQQYMKLKAEFENEMDSKNISLQKELRQVQAENKYHLDTTSQLQTEMFNINLEMKKIQEQKEKIESQRQTLINKLEGLKNTFKQFGSSTMENLVEINKKLQELRNTSNDKTISEIQDSIIEIQESYLKIAPFLCERDQKTISQTNDRMPELEFGIPGLMYKGQGEKPARKSVKGGHDPSQIQQVQQVTGLAAIFGAFGILRFLMYAIIIVVLVVMVWHLFSSWCQEQSCRPYLADIYGLENEYYNHYIYS